MKGGNGVKSFLANYIIIPKCGTVREKVFMTRIALGLTAIIFCMAALTYSAYAYFSHGVSSNKTTIAAANYTLEYTVMVGDVRPQGGVATVETVTEIAPSDLDGTYKLQPGVYTVKMTKPEASKASTGFCRVEVCDIKGNAVTHYTQQIGKVSPEETQTTRYILIEVKNADAFLKLTASWGTCARTDMILTNGELEFTAEGNTSTEPPESSTNTDPEANPDNTDGQNGTDGVEDGEDGEGGQASVDDPDTDGDEQQTEPTETTDPSEPTASSEQ